MKKSSLILSIISAILAIGALLLVWFMPAYVNVSNAPLVPTSTVLTKILPALGGLFALQASSTNPSSVYFEIALLIGFLLLNALWIVHLVMLILKKRPSATAVDVLWIVFGFMDICIGLCAVGQASGGVVFESGANATYNYHDLFGFIATTKPTILVMFLIVFPYLLGLISFVLGVVAISISLADVIKHPAIKKETISDLNRKEAITQIATNESTLAAVPSEEELKAAQYRELEEQSKAANPKDGKPDPYIVQNFYYGPAPIGPEAGKPVKPGEGPNDDHPLTAKDLRKIVEEEAAGKTGSDENKPLNVEEARSLIQEELKANREKATPEEKTEETVPSETQPEETSENDMMTSDDLRKIIKEEMTAAIGEKTMEGLKADDIRLIVKEEIASLAKTSDAIAQNVVAAQKVLADQEALKTSADEKRDAAILALQGSLVSADQIRVIIAEELGKKSEAKSSETIVTASAPEAKEETVVSTEATSETTPAEETISSPEAGTSVEAASTKGAAPEMVEETKLAEKAAMASESPVAETASAQETPVVAVASVETAPIQETVTAPVSETTPAEQPVPEVHKPKIIRIPFPTRLLAADQKLQNNYNELKSEALSYGLKSRLSNSGDTFRLHTKTYMKLTVAGKGLKLYFALDPKDFVDSPIPVKDAGAKNIYKEIPAVFKVKSPLSLRRAIELLALVCGNDNLVKKEPVPHNYAIELKDYKPQLGGDGDDD